MVRECAKYQCDMKDALNLGILKVEKIKKHLNSKSKSKSYTVQIKSIVHDCWKAFLWKLLVKLIQGHYSIRAVSRTLFDDIVI